MAVAQHIVKVGLFSVDSAGVRIDKESGTTTINQMKSAELQQLVIPDADVANSAGYPTVKAYLELEAGDDYVLGKFDQYGIVTYDRGTMNQTVIYAAVAVSSCSGSGPSYTVNYGSSVTDALIGDTITAVHHTAGDVSDILSTYTYQVTGITDSDTLTVKYITDDDGAESALGDDSPCDLNSGGGSSGSPENAPHKFTRDLGSAFEMFVE